LTPSFGTFHEQILGGISGYGAVKSGGFDIKALDGTLFADIKNKHNTMNSSAAEALFQKLARYADDDKQAKCYWVQILAKESFCEPWHAEINGREYGHSRVFKISGDRFYALLSGREDALFQLYRALPRAIDDYLETVGREAGGRERSALREIAGKDAWQKPLKHPHPQAKPSARHGNGRAFDVGHVQQVLRVRVHRENGERAA